MYQKLYKQFVTVAMRIWLTTIIINSILISIYNSGKSFYEGFRSKLSEVIIKFFIVSLYSGAHSVIALPALYFAVHFISRSKCYYFKLLLLSVAGITICTTVYYFTTDGFKDGILFSELDYLIPLTMVAGFASIMLNRRFMRIDVSRQIRPAATHSNCPSE